MTRVYWDTCVVIYRVEQHTPWAERITGQLQRIEGPLALHVSPLVAMECRVGPLKSGHEELLARYDQFFRHPRLQWQELDRGVFELATQLRAQHRLKTPDALHLACAVQAGCDQFWTNDGRLAGAASGLMGVVDLSAVAA